tara:strand:+ start:1380 stop:1940 length:561 start_codon:yes stop_codon:yes gene_type:complete
MSRYLGHTSVQWEKSQLDARFRNPSAAEAMNDALINPQNYTTAMPNGSSKAAFTVGSTVGAGRDGMQRGPDTVYYKIEQPKAPAPVAASAPAPPPVAPPVKKEPKGPVEYSPEIQEAKERVNKYESDIKSGDTSEKIYNRSYTKESNLDFNNNLDFSSKTYGGQSSKAAASFLDNKKQSVKNSFSI